MIRRNAKKVGVIGGGLGGLAAACTLAARGYSVTLFERNSWVGGKAAVLNGAGYRFDMGPTILTLPSVLKRIFSEAGQRLEDYLELIPLDPQWRSFFDDGTTLDLVSDCDKMKGILREFSADGDSCAEGYEKFISLSQRLHEISDRYFFWRSIGGLRDMVNFKETFKPAILKDVLQMRMGRSVAGTVRSHVPDARVAQMIDHFTQYVGSAPDASPAVLCGIAHMQTEEGVWYPRGGTGAVPKALASLAINLGVSIQTDTRVDRIVIEKHQVTGVETNHGFVPLQAVISNCDSVRTYRELIGGDIGQDFERRRSYEPACSGVVLYLGLDRRYDQFLHHNFVFSHDPEEEFDYIYRKGEPAPDPTCYVCAPAISEPEVAPAGGEALYILVHTPYLRPQHNWKEMLPRYRQIILNKLASTAGIKDLEKHIVFEQALTPEDIDRRYHVMNGAIYGLASHGKFVGAFKPGNRTPDAEGLYLAGGAAHPGPGMPMVMMSGWIAADALDKDAVAQKFPADNVLEKGLRKMVP
ncbi:MAG: phytoene desaturase family protein, partial [Limisphaerales bacterium]